MKKTLFAVLLALALSGCASPPRTIYKPSPVTIPLPIACEMPVVLRPDWPTRGLSPDADLFTQTKMILAELELRESYEIRLNAAMKSCQL